MTIEQLEEEIDSNTEYLQTTEQEEIACISIENLEAILNRYGIGVKLLNK